MINKTKCDFFRLGVTTVLKNAKKPKSLSGTSRNIYLMPKINLQHDCLFFS
jgi:hypothetical protein